MAVGWVTALKLVPWGDVLEATPQILQAAKKLLGSTRQGTADAAAGTLAGAGDAATPPVTLQLQQLRERVARLLRQWGAPEPGEDGRDFAHRLFRQLPCMR